MISIHAPREGSDRHYFFSRKAADISIHAPREGSDDRLRRQSRNVCDFNPRSPRGERLPAPVCFPHFPRFQSTLPARGATRDRQDVGSGKKRFQSTLPARGATANVHRFLDKICTVCIKNRAFFSQCLIQTTSNAESVGKTRCYFGANLQAFIDSLYFALLQNQHFFWHIRGFASKMLYFVFVMVPKIIET